MADRRHIQRAETIRRPHEVYEIHEWHTAGSTEYAFRKHEDVALPGRWEFTGSVAAPDIRRRYVGESVAHYFTRGAQAPVLYVNL